MLERKDINDPERVKLDQAERDYMDSQKQKKEKDLLEQVKKL
jgi:hypothetical protein